MSIEMQERLWTSHVPLRIVNGKTEETKSNAVATPENICTPKKNPAMHDRTLKCRLHPVSLLLVAIGRTLSLKVGDIP